MALFTGTTFRNPLIALSFLLAVVTILQGCGAQTKGGGETSPSPTPQAGIIGLSLTSGPVGTPVTITGTNFGAAQGTSTVTFNGTAGTPTAWSATSITVAVPSGATAGNVVVTVGGVASNGVNFTVTTAALITVAISPKRAGLMVTQGLSVTATTNDTAGVTWTASGGSFSAGKSLTGVAVTYTAPSSAGSYTITATSVTNPATASSITVYVTNLGGVYTYHNDLARDGVNSQEYALTTSNVNTSTFGKLFSCTVDGAVYAQPLWIANLTINGGKHNVVFVATQHDSLFAFDADANPCVQLWTVSLIDTNHGASSGETTVPSGPNGNKVGHGSGDITPEVGVTGTPVIDPSSNTLYVVSKSMNSGGTSFYQRRHAIDITTGNEKLGGPANITSSITFPGTGDGGSTVSFSTQQQNQRPGLALVNGVVYVAWASHEDTAPYYGWVVGFNVSTLAITNVLNVSPNVQYGGIWMSGGAPAADSTYLYLITGNATFDVTNASAPSNDYGDSFLELTQSLAVSQYFTPSDQANDAANDFDFGAGGAAILVNVPSGPTPNLVVGGGKDGNLYVLNRNSLGGSGDSNAWQHFPLGNGIFSTAAFWNNTLYIGPIHSSLEAFAFNTSTDMFNTSPSSQSSSPSGTYNFPGTTPSPGRPPMASSGLWITRTIAPHSHLDAAQPFCMPTMQRISQPSSGTVRW